MSASVCVIEGDPAVRDSLTTLMRLSGYEVCAYETGSAFLQALNANLFDCVVCEAELPDTTGVAVFQALSRKKFPVRFALLMSRSDPAALATAHRVGIRDVFPKPIVHRRLIDFVSRTAK